MKGLSVGRRFLVHLGGPRPLIHRPDPHPLALLRTEGDSGKCLNIDGYGGSGLERYEFGRQLVATVMNVSQFEYAVVGFERAGPFLQNR